MYHGDVQLVLLALTAAASLCTAVIALTMAFYR